MAETSQENLYTSPSIKGKLFRVAGGLALSDYEPNSAIHSRRKIESLWGGYPFNRYSICKGFSNLGANLKDSLSQFDSVLCEGVGGVIVSQVFAKLIDKARSKEGEGAVKIYYLASGQHSRAYTEIEKYLAKRSERLGKTLVCTDFVASGHSLENLTSILERLGIGYEAAILESDWYGEEFQSRFKGKVNIGMVHYAMKIQPATEDINDPEVNGYYRDRDSTYPLLKKYSGGELVKDTQRNVGIFVEKLAKLLDL